MDAVLNLILGLLLRIGIPVLVTVGIFFLLRRLDERWQAEARALPVLNTNQKPCWEAKACSAEKQKACPAYAKSNVPCWQVFRAKDGVLKETCLGCDVFRQARVPARS